MKYYSEQPTKRDLSLFVKKMEEAGLRSDTDKSEEIYDEAQLLWRILVSKQNNLRPMITDVNHPDYENESKWDSLDLVKVEKLSAKDLSQGRVLPALDKKEWKAAVERVVNNALEVKNKIAG